MLCLIIFKSVYFQQLCQQNYTNLQRAITRSPTKILVKNEELTLKGSPYYINLADDLKNMNVLKIYSLVYLFLKQSFITTC